MSDHASLIHFCVNDHASPSHKWPCLSNFMFYYLDYPITEITIQLNKNISILILVVITPYTMMC